MPDIPVTPSNPREAQWAEWPLTALDRVRLSYGWVILFVALLGTAGLVFDVALHYSMRGIWPAYEMAFGIVGIVAAVYIPLALRFVKRASRRALVQLRRSVAIDDQQYDRFARRLLAADGRVEAGLLTVALLLVVVFLILPPDQLPELASYGLVGIIGSVVLALFYTLLFWLLLSLVYTGIRSGRVL